MAIAHASHPVVAKFFGIAVWTAFACLSTSAQSPSGTPGTAGTVGAAGTSAPAGTAGTSSGVGTSQPAQTVSPTSTTTFGTPASPAQNVTPGGTMSPQPAVAAPVTTQFGVVQPNAQTLASPTGEMQRQSQAQTRLPQTNGPSALANGQTGFGFAAQPQTLSSDIAAAATMPNFAPFGIGFGITDGRLVVETLDPSGVFFGSGLERGDVLVSLAGHPIQSEAGLARLAAMYVNQPVPLVVSRGGKQQTIHVTLPRHERPAGAHPFDSQSYFGARLNSNVPEMAVVATVEPGSPAEIAGLRPDDVLSTLNGVPVRSRGHAVEILASLRPGQRLDIAFSRRVENFTRAVLESRFPTAGEGSR